jgi:hypothetical protein
MGQGASLGEEAVLADSGRAVEMSDFFSILQRSELRGMLEIMSRWTGRPAQPGDIEGRYAA